MKILLDTRRTDPAAPAPLADGVFEWLAEQIVRGELRPGQWISENEVAAKLGVSRSPVREAMRNLAREGLVEVLRHRGTVMAELDADEAEDLYRARQLVEPEMARQAVQNITDEIVEQAAEIAGDLRTAVGDPYAFHDAFRRFYQLLMDLCPSRAIRDMVAMLWRRTIRFRGMSLRVPGWEPQRVALRFAERFVELARARDADGAYDATIELLETTRQLVMEDFFIQVGRPR